MSKIVERCRGPARQFLALVGDDDGAIRRALDGRLQTVVGEDNCYFIDNHYYAAKFGIKEFPTLDDVAKEFETDHSSLACFFLAYKSMSHMKEAKEVAEKIKTDTRVLILASAESCPEVDQVESFANRNQFEAVFLNPNEEQKADAEELAEKVGIERLIETIEVCNWPWRVAAAVLGMKSDEELSEQRIDEEDVLGGASAELIMQQYVRWFQANSEPSFPSPQHAERVHLSPDSPTTTEGTTTHDDVSISVDIDLVCMKNQSSTEQNRFENSDKEKRTDKTTLRKMNR